MHHYSVLKLKVSGECGNMDPSPEWCVWTFRQSFLEKLLFWWLILRFYVTFESIDVGWSLMFYSLTVIMQGENYENGERWTNQRERHLSFYSACTHIPTSFPPLECNIPRAGPGSDAEAWLSTPSHSWTPLSLVEKSSRVSSQQLLVHLLIYPVR